MIEYFTGHAGMMIISQAFIAAALSGLIGPWILARRTAFFTHATGSASLPGSVIASAAGVSSFPLALASSLLFSGLVAIRSKTTPNQEDASTLMMMIGATALGVIIASDVLDDQVGSQNLLFGSIFAAESTTISLSILVLLAALLGNFILGKRWQQVSFDNQTDTILGGRSTELLLFLLIASAAVSLTSLTGTLLAGSILVIPAAAARPFASSMLSWQLWTLTLTICVFIVGTLASFSLNTPPGPAIALLCGLSYLLSVPFKHTSLQGLKEI